jgi:hypothetical protein
MPFDHNSNASCRMHVLNCCLVANRPRFPSERKEVKDPVTGTMLSFLTVTQQEILKFTRRIRNGPQTANGSSSARTAQGEKLWQ